MSADRPEDKTIFWPEFDDVIASYDRDAAFHFDRYEKYGLSQDKLHGVLLLHMPADITERSAPFDLLDIGAGSGRDAAYFRACGARVVAVEPADGLRLRAMAKHGADNINWLKDSLPHLVQVVALGRKYDLILLSAVWMHVPPERRADIVQLLQSLLKPEGLLAFRVRHGAPPEGRAMFDVTPQSMEDMAQNGLVLVGQERMEDVHNRPGIYWSSWLYKIAEN